MILERKWFDKKGEPQLGLAEGETDNYESLDDFSERNRGLLVDGNHCYVRIVEDDSKD